MVQDLRSWAGLYMPHKRLDLEQREVVAHAAEIPDPVLPRHPGRPGPRPKNGWSPATRPKRSSSPPAEEKADLIVMGTHGRKGLEYSLVRQRRRQSGAALAGPGADGQSGDAAGDLTIRSAR
ncbi:MAG: hypothetical protein MZV70_19900 [Desulfobacterales bacterium]|nr:hypothetical protein [Desulfobacterales bacterium]